MKLIDQQFSEEVSRLWNEWEVRVVILLSLLLQIILIIFGSQRKYRTGSCIKFFVWSTYMGADWVATVALGNLAKIQANREKYSLKQYNIGLQAFWAPFLLLHLGGPDTITAYSLEDNELWKRHFLGLVVEVGVAIYVFFRSFNNSAITYVFIPIFVAGIIKYGERTYALRAASNSQFKEDLVSTDTIVENAMRIAMGIKEEDLFEMELMEQPSVTSFEDTLRGKHFSNSIEEAHFLFKRLEYLFADMILPFNDRIECYHILEKSCEEAFKLIEIELGFLYDVLYTKGKIIHTRSGFFLRIICFFSTVSALIFFTVVIDLHVFSRIDIFITLLLLAGAVFLEVYASIVFLFSDWTKICPVKKQIPEIPRFLKSPFTKKRWSESVAQYNLINFSLAKMQSGKFINGVRKLPYIKKWIDEHQQSSVLSWKAVDDHMKNMIFHQLQNKAEKIKDNYTMKSCKELLAHRGDYVCEKFGSFGRFSWSTISLEFDHSLLVWHIATDICYYTDSDGHLCNRKRETSKYLSDYMLYLLFRCPSMLPKGIGKIRYKDTCEQVLKFLKENKEVIANVIEVRRMMRDSKISKRHITQSILSDGCKLAKELQQLEPDHQESNPVSTSKSKWDMISEVWVEMLIYAASHCGWREHGQQLWKGGELLTHVCVLMAHLGLSEQYNEKEVFYLV